MSRKKLKANDGGPVDVVEIGEGHIFDALGIRRLDKND